jgi:hypothetical protein
MWLFLDPEYSIMVFHGIFPGQWEKNSLHERFAINFPEKEDLIHLGVTAVG